jgi:uncharacterized membrane protein YfcA
MPFYDDLLSVSISMSALSALAATALVAALARGFSGFGGALIFVPLASALVGPRTAAPLLLIVDGILTLGFIPHAWRLANKREVGAMALGATAGVPLGTWFLTSIDPTIIRWAIVVLAGFSTLDSGRLAAPRKSAGSGQKRKSFT